MVSVVSASREVTIRIAVCVYNGMGSVNLFDRKGIPINCG